MKIIDKIKGLFKKDTNLNEDDFYKKFFTKNKSWSSFEPNEDEKIRLEEIFSSIDSLDQSSNLKIIDVGCGRGWLANKLKDYGAVTAIDPVESVIDFAKKQYKNIIFEALKPNEFINSKPNSKFDLIVSSEVLEHVIDKQGFLQTLNQLLNKKGHLILTTPRKENFDKFTTTYGKAKYQPVEEWVSEAEIRDLFEKSDFEIISHNFFSPLPNYEEDFNIYQIWTCKKK